MPIDQYELRQAASRNFTFTKKSAAYGQRKGFLCHSHADRNLALGFQQKLKEEGLDLYIDWQDLSMPPEPNRETAEKIKLMIRDADVFLFLATENSMASRWCPWEIGYADGVKRSIQIAIVPTRDSNGRFYGNEYLQLYRRIDKTNYTSPLRWFDPGSISSHSVSTF